MIAILSALFGALAGGLVQTILAERNYRREREAIIVAIASEVGSICQTLRYAKYLEDHQKILNEEAAGTWDGKVWVIDIRSHYFSVFEALSSKLGQLQPHHTASIVRFYVLCKSAVDNVRPDGPGAEDTDVQRRLANASHMVILLTEILGLGDEIVQLPRLPLLFAAL